MAGFVAWLMTQIGLEDVSGLEPGGYLEVMLQQVPIVYWGALAVSFGAVFAAWWWTAPSQNIPQMRKALHEEEENEKDQLSNAISKYHLMTNVNLFPTMQRRMLLGFHQPLNIFH